MLHRVFCLRNAIDTFCDMKGRPEVHLRDPKWVADLAFLSDITAHLNTLNTSLQGEKHNICDLVGKIQAFKRKLILWENQLRARNTGHFPLLETVKEGVDFDEYESVIRQLQEEFEKRFSELSELQAALDIFVRPFSLCADSVPQLFQLELIDLQCNVRLKDRFLMSRSLEKFYRGFPQEEYPRLYKHACKVLSMFGSTYICERFFSVLKLTKSKHRATMSDSNLRNCLRIAVSRNIVPNLEKIVCSKPKSS